MTTSNLLSIGVLNCQSVRNKTDAIKDYLLELDLDVLFLTETWLKSGSVDNSVISDLVPTGYTFKHKPRDATHRGGGLGILHKTSISLKLKTETSTRSSFECMQCCFTVKSTNIHTALIYRPPPSEKNKIPKALFLTEFSDLFESLSIIGGKLLIVGDFNIPWNDKTDTEMQQVDELLSSCNMIQHVNFTTHLGGKTLDYVISRVDDNLISSVSPGDIIADHATVLARMHITKPHTVRKKVSLRKLKTIDKEKFKMDLFACLSHLVLPDDVSEAFDRFHQALRHILDTHAPLQEKLISIRPKVPWMNDKILQARREKRKAERKWRATGLEVHKEIFRSARNHLSYILTTTKADFYKAQVEECENDQKKLFSVVDQLLHQKQAPALPSYTSAMKLAEAFSDYFVSKIENIRTKIDQNSIPTVSPTYDPPRETMTEFTPTTTEEVHKLIKGAKGSTCELDPLPTKMLKEFIDTILHTITNIMNISLSTGTVPSSLKHAIIRPHLKKPTLDSDELKNYRPLSNLPFLSKVLEKIIVNRLLSHMSDHALHEPMQSAYKQYHSTETALVRVQNDILVNLDNKRGVILVLLDLSAAFDTIDHTTLIHLLQNRLGLASTALDWFKSYLSGRTQSVCIEGEYSNPVPLQYGVPQGSVLGPLLFTIYTLPLGDLLRDEGVSYHLYADDTQLYLSFDLCDSVSQLESLHKMQQCVCSVKSWMTHNKLKLNDEKTEIVFMSSRFNRNPISLDSFAIDATHIKPATSVRNIGVIFDDAMTMNNQITAICKSAHFHLRNIGRIRKCISYEACEKLVHAFVTSRLDCGNALLYGLPDNQLKRLQRMLHIAARILTLTRPFDHITPVLKQLHWLPIRSRIDYKILLLTFKALNGLAPQYLCDLLTPHAVSSYGLRSNDMLMLERETARTTHYGERAFSYAAPKLWNTLLTNEMRNICNIDAFKKELKRLLFESGY